MIFMKMMFNLFCRRGFHGNLLKIRYHGLIQIMDIIQLSRAIGIRQEVTIILNVLHSLKAGLLSRRCRFLTKLEHFFGDSVGTTYL